MGIMPVKTSQKFKILIERDEDGYFVATVPALPGCVTQAKTLPELDERAREAIKLCLDVAKTDAGYRRRMKRFAYEPSFIGLDVVSV